MCDAVPDDQAATEPQVRLKRGKPWNVISEALDGFLGTPLGTIVGRGTQRLLDEWKRKTDQPRAIPSTT